MSCLSDYTAVDWAGRITTLQAIIGSEFVRNWLLPIGGTVLTGTSGIFGGVPLMWVVVASSAAFMFLTFGMVGNLALRERNTP